VVEGGAMLAAGALLTPRKRVRAGELWAGRPAEFMRAIAPDEAVRFRQTAKNYAERAREYLGAAVTRDREGADYA
jgi:carbonic anhydrase/acetyltransferase-like protein (isoleucine patch superfamily)